MLERLALLAARLNTLAAWRPLPRRIVETWGKQTPVSDCFQALPMGVVYYSFIYIYTSYYSPIFLDQDALNLRSSHSFPWLIYRGYPMILIVHWGEKFFACWFVLCQYGQWLLLLLSFSPFSLPGCSPSIPVTISMLSHVSAGRSLPNFTLYWHPILGGGNPKSKMKKIYTHTLE